MFRSAQRTYFVVRGELGSGTGLCFYDSSLLFSIPRFHECRLMRYFPSPSVDITLQIQKFQRLWRRWHHLRLFYSHPRTLQFRQLYGRWPPLPPVLLVLHR